MHSASAMATNSRLRHTETVFISLTSVGRAAGIGMARLIMRSRPEAVKRCRPEDSRLPAFLKRMSAALVRDRHQGVVTGEVLIW
jgi:hypothetical protein